MQLTNKQIQLAQTIDNWAKTIEKQGGGDIELLQNSLSQMATFKNFEKQKALREEHKKRISIKAKGIKKFLKDKLDKIKNILKISSD